MVETPTMFEEFDYMGYWWVSGDKENKRAGAMTYKPGAGVKLDLLDEYKFVEGQASASSSAPPENVDVFLGSVMENAHWITLLDNRRVDVRPGQNLVQSIYWPKYLLLGNWTFSPKDITLESTFKSAEVILSSLRGWMKSQPPSSESPEQGRHDLLKFAVHAVSSNATVETTISLQVAIESAASSVEKRQERKNIIRIKPRRPQTLEWFRNQIDSIRFLVTFLSGTPIECKRFRALPAKDNPDSFWVDVFHHIRPPEEDEDENFYMPFSYHLLEERAEDVFRSWFERDENMRVPFNICMGIIYGERRDLRIEFLSLVQALESFHQITTGTHNDRSIRLRNRLNSVRNCLSQELQTLVEIDDGFLKAVVDTRDYYTHYNPDKRKKAFKDFALYDAVARLIPFVVVVLARNLCISDELILESFEESVGLWRRPRIKEHEFYSM